MGLGDTVWPEACPAPGPLNIESSWAVQGSSLCAPGPFSEPLSPETPVEPAMSLLTLGRRGAGPAVPPLGPAQLGAASVGAAGAAWGPGMVCPGPGPPLG